jgi:hypothetical protein
MPAGRPAMIARRRSGRPLHFLPTAIGPALIPFRDMASRKLHLQERMAVRKLVLYFLYVVLYTGSWISSMSNLTDLTARRRTTFARLRSTHPLLDV